MSLTAEKQDTLNKISELIGDIEVAMLTSRDTNGHLHSRPMHTVKKTFNGELFFFTNYPTDKTDEILFSDEVNIAYVEDDTYVSVAGKASIMQDDTLKKNLWDDSLSVWYGDDPTADNIALIHVQAHHAQYWDAPTNPLGKALQRFRVEQSGNDNAGIDSEWVSY